MGSTSSEMAEFDRWLAEHHMEGYWHNDARPAAFTPHIWKWAEIQEAVVTVPRALIAQTIDLIVVLSGRGRQRRLADLTRLEGLGPDGAYQLSPA